MAKKCILPTPEQEIKRLRKEIVQDLKHWQNLREYGCQDPFWADGVNMNLTRNHIIYYKMMLERGMPVDEILFCDTGIEFPAMYEHLNRVEQYTGRKITRLKAKHDFYWWFWCNQKVKGKMAGQFGMSWPGFKARWCTKRLKHKVTADYLRGTGDYVQYIGIAADEPKRHRNIPDNVRHPLYDWGITEQQALQYCYDHGFDWDGLYEHFDRVSCWLCPLQGIKELRTLRKVFPELWSKLRVMDALTYYQYRADYSIEQLERRFALEDAQECLWGDDVND